MFRTLIYPSSGACNCVVDLPHRSSCSQFVVFVFQASACKTSTTQNQPHQISNTQRTENKTSDVVNQQHSCKLLMMDILMSKTCWAHKKWNKIASDIKLVFHSSTITMMHGPINIRCNSYCFSTAIAVARKRLSVTLYVHCQSFHHLTPNYNFCDHVWHLSYKIYTNILNF